MIQIDQNYVDAAAPNAGAINNGRGLVLKGKFVKLHKSDDESLLFGECSGSGKSNYHVSCDFVNPDSPVHRCSCPSRQFPCKHCLGLMYAWVDGKSFTVADVPEDVAGKREKIEKRVQKKKEEATKPRKVNKAALAKKIKAQLDGLDLLEKLTRDLVRTGMGNTNAKTARQIEEQAKQLGNAYLPGAQAALHSYTKLFTGDDGRFDADVSATQREAIYGDALDQLTRLQSLTRQGRAYLKSRLDDPELKPETESGIAAWLGHAWQLRELSEAGLVENDAEQIQLAFNSYDDVARAEFVDTGVWMNLKSGAIQLTQTFKPYKAMQYIKGEDSFFQVAQVKELCVYPGDVNPRVRWEGMLPREVTPADYKTVHKHGHADFAALIKEVKTHLKSPLADKHPVYAINFAKIGTVGDDVVVEDKQGERLALTEKGMTEEPASCHLLPMLPKELLKQQTMIARFSHDLDTRQLRIKPLSIVSKSALRELTLPSYQQRNLAMSIAVLTQVYDETRRLAIAGSSLAPGDFRLKKLIPPLQKAGEKAPVFAKVAELAERLVDGTDKDSADTLLNLSTVVCSVLYTQGETGAAGTLKPLETVDLGPPVTGTSARVLKPLIEALTTTGSGRLEIIQDAVDRKAFRDMRLVNPAIKAIDDPYGEIGDLIADEVLPVFGKSIYDRVRSDFDIKGRGGHVRRLRLLHKLDPAATRDLVEEALESGSKEMKVAALSCVGNTGSGLNYLLDQVNAKAKDVRSVALAGLATSKNAKAVEALIAALTGKDAEIAIGPASQNRSPKLLKYLLDESQAQLETALTEKTKAKRGAALSRLQLLLRGFVERSDKKSVDFLKSIFDRRDELSDVKGSGASSADGNEIVSIVTQLLVTTGNKPMLKTLAESHAGLPGWALQCCFVSAMQTMTAKEVYDEYSPYLLAKEPKKKSKNDQIRQRKEGIVSTLIDVVEGRHAWRYDARYYYGVDTDFELGQFAKGVELDPRWLEAAMKIDDCNLAMLLKRPGDKALNDYLTKQLTGMLSKRDKEWEISHVLEAMIEIEHPDIVELFMQCLQKLLGRNRQYYHTYWISRLIPSLPKAAITPLEEMIPSMPDKAADEIIPHIADLKTRHGG